MKNHSCRTTWCAATVAAPNRAATAAADRKHAWKARLRASRSRPMASCARSSAGTGRSATGSSAGGGGPFPVQGVQEQPRPHRLARDVGRGRPDETQARDGTETVHQRCAQHRRHTVARQHVAQRPGGVLHAAHPPVAGQRHQHQRCPAQRQPQPGLRGGRHRSPVAERPRHRPGHELPDPEDEQPDRERQPGGLHPLADRGGAVPRTVQPGRARRGAVGEEVELARDLGEHDGRHGQPGERDGPQPADDGRVDQQVQRFRGQHRQRGPGQPRDLAQRHAAAGHGVRGWRHT